MRKLYIAEIALKISSYRSPKFQIFGLGIWNFGLGI
jgi:hypothetical protein